MKEPHNLSTEARARARTQTPEVPSSQLFELADLSSAASLVAARCDEDGNDGGTLVILRASISARGARSRSQSDRQPAAAAHTRSNQQHRGGCLESLGIWIAMSVLILHIRPTALTLTRTLPWMRMRNF